MAKHEEVNTLVIAAIGLISAVLLFVLIVGLEVLYYNYENKEETKKVYDQRYEEIAGLRAVQEAELNSYRWIDKERGIVGIPIERAMELVAKDLASGSAQGRNNETSP